MKTIFLIMLLAGISRSDGGSRGWVFFDLGEVLVSKKPDGRFRIVEGSLEFIANLRDQGFKLGLIVNLPEKVGKTCSEKSNWLHTYLNDRIDPEPFNWNLFDRLLIPAQDSFRKPHPLLFMSALELACRLDRPVAFIGENRDEIYAASRLGFATMHVDPRTGFVGKNLTDFEGRIDQYFISAFPPKCDYQKSLEKYRVVDSVTGLGPLARCSFALR